jgi:DnaJ-class molecular chaperone
VVADDLEMDPVALALAGGPRAEVQIETPDGPVTLTVPAGTQRDDGCASRPRAAAPGWQRGNLYAVARILVPETAERRRATAYEALKRMASATADRRRRERQRTPPRAPVSGRSS